MMSTERTLLHLLVGPDPCDDVLRRIVDLGAQVSWGALAARARSAGVAGIVHRRLERELAGLDVPAEPRAHLRASYRATLADNLARLHVADEVVGVLNHRGVVPIVLKGALLVETHYRDPGLRPMRDVDLLVRSADLEAAEQAVIGLGFRRLTTAGRSASETRHYQRAYVRGKAKIELHRGLCDVSRYPLDVASLWNRSKTLVWRNRTVSALAPEDHLAYVALHTALHSFLLPLISVVDIAVVLRESPELAAKAATRAREWAATTAVGWALRLARDLCGAPVPEAVLQAMRPAAARDLFLRACLHGDQMPAFRWGRSLRVAQALTLLPLMDRGRARYLGTYLSLRIEDWLRARTRSPKVPLRGGGPSKP